MYFCYLETIKENIEFGFEKLRATITSQIPAFLLRDSSFILSNNFSELDSSVTCGNLFKYIEDSDLAESIKKSIRSSKRKVVYINAFYFYPLVKMQEITIFLFKVIPKTLIIYTNKRTDCAVSACLCLWWLEKATTHSRLIFFFFKLVQYLPWCTWSLEF